MARQERNAQDVGLLPTVVLDGSLQADLALTTECQRSGRRTGSVTNGSLYGTAYGGGTGSCPNDCGAVYKLTLAEALTTLHNFEPTAPANPIAGLILGTDGNFYGTSYAGGTAGDWGTVFEMSPRVK